MLEEHERFREDDPANWAAVEAPRGVERTGPGNRGLAGRRASARDGGQAERTKDRAIEDDRTVRQICSL